METELNIKLNSEDCKKIFDDLKPFIEGKNGLNEKTYHLYNKIKFFITAYDSIEED